MGENLGYKTKEILTLLFQIWNKYPNIQHRNGNNLFLKNLPPHPADVPRQHTL